MKNILTKNYFSKLMVFGLVLFVAMIFFGTKDVLAVSRCDFTYTTKDLSAVSLSEAGTRDVCETTYSGKWTNTGNKTSKCEIKGRTCLKSTPSECNTLLNTGLQDVFKTKVSGPLASGSVQISTMVCTDPTAQKTTPTASTSTKVEGQLGYKGTVGGFIPDCSELPNNCRDISIFVVTLIGITKYLFSIVGALFLLMFIYVGT